MSFLLSILFGAIGGLVATIMGYNITEAGWWGWFFPFVIINLMAQDVIDHKQRMK